MRHYSVRDLRGRTRPTYAPRLELLEDRRPPSDVLLGYLFEPTLLLSVFAESAAAPVAQPPTETETVRPAPWQVTGSGSTQQPFVLPELASSPTAAVAEPSQDLLETKLASLLVPGSDDDATIAGPSWDVSGNIPANDRNICTNGRGRLQNETAIAAYGNVVVVGYNDSRGWSGNGCPTQAPGYQITGWAYSTDYGATFTDGGPLPVTNRIDVQGDPWLAVGPNGEIYSANLWRGVSGLAILRGQIHEKGVDWNPNPVILQGAAGGPTWDKEAIAVDPNYGYVFLTYTRFGGPGGIHLFRSFDGGASFDGPIPIATGTNHQASQAVVGPNNELYVMWTDRTGATATNVGFAVSYDWGNSFTAPRNIAPWRNVSVLGADRGSPFGHMAIDRSGGKYDGSLYIVYHSSHISGTHNDAFLIYSRDGGANWSAPILINDDFTAAQQWWPSVSVDDAGFVNVFYFDRRNFATTSRETEMYFAQSRDGGETFLPSFPVTEFPTTWGLYQEGGFTVTGDYTRSTSNGLDSFVAYVDHRDTDPDVYVTRVSTLT